MFWTSRFLDLGHNVVGVEFVEECVREYFSENDLEIEEATCPLINCKILQVNVAYIYILRAW